MLKTKINIIHLCNGKRQNKTGSSFRKQNKVLLRNWIKSKDKQKVYRLI